MSSRRETVAPPMLRMRAESSAAGSPDASTPSSSACATHGAHSPSASRSGTLEHMLESAEIGHKVAKRTYVREAPKLREALLNAQYDLSQSGRGPVLMIISGVEAGGRGETANKLTEWMDPRHIRVVAFGPRTSEEAVHPPAWRYWRALPPNGRIGIFMNAWYNEAIFAGTRGEIDEDVLHSH